MLVCFDQEVENKLGVKNNDELMKVMPEEWSILLKQNEGFVAVHTMLVLWRAVCCVPDLYNPLNEKQ